MAFTGQDPGIRRALRLVIAIHAGMVLVAFAAGALADLREHGPPRHAHG